MSVLHDWEIFYYNYHSHRNFRYSIYLEQLYLRSSYLMSTDTFPRKNHSSYRTALLSYDLALMFTLNQGQAMPSI